MSSKYWFTHPLNIFPNNWYQSRPFWRSLAARRKISQNEQSRWDNIYLASTLQRKQFNLLKNTNNILYSVSWSRCMSYCWRRLSMSSLSSNRCNDKKELWNKCKGDQCTIRESEKIKICQGHVVEYSKGNMGQNHSKLWMWYRGKKC